MHAFINKLKARVQGISNGEEKQKVLIKEQITIVSPLLSVCDAHHTLKEGTWITFQALCEYMVCMCARFVTATE